jgi:hypothetical protein
MDMGDLTLNIKADAAQAKKEFKELAESSEAVRGKIEKFTESFKADQLNKFVDQQKLLEISLKGTRGEVAAMTAAQNNYQRKIESLIRSGLDPESDAIVKLRAEHDALAGKIEKATEANAQYEKSTKAAETALKAIAAAAAAASAAIAAAVQKTAEAGDAAAKTARIVGTSAESWQELEYAAGMSGIESAKLKTSMEKLNKTMGDLKGGTGALSKFLAENDKALLSNLQNAGGTEEAFMLLMDAINKAPDEFTRAKLAQEAFGKSGQDLILLAEEGAAGIAELREEARKYGVISNEAAAQSEEYLDAQDRVQQALSGVRNAFAEKLMPAMTDIINNFANMITKVTDFVAGIKDLPGILEKVGWALGIVVAALGAFIIVNKITKAMAALNAVMLANPFGLLAAAIAAVIVAVVLLYKNWDVVSTYIQQAIARIVYAVQWIGSVIKEKFVVAVNSVKIAFMSLVDIIQSKVLGAVAKMLEVMGKLPFVGEMFQDASRSVRNFSENISANIAAVKEESRALVQAAHDEQDATQAALDTKLAAIDEGARARREELARQKAENAATEKEITESAIAAQEARSAAAMGSLKEFLAALGQTEAQAENERVNQLTKFMQARLDAEQQYREAQNENDIMASGERLAYLEEQKNLLLAQFTEGSEEQLALQTAYNNMVLDEDRRLKEEERKLLEERAGAFTTFFGGLGSLMDTFGEHNRAAAVAAKALAAAEAGINSYLAFTKALASGPPPFNYIAAAGVLAAGLAQQVKIVSTAIPSAETGGRFVVPDTSRVDGALYRFNGGEQIDVTPRGMTGETAYHFQFVFDSKILYDVVNRGARAGELYTLQLAGNL